MKSRGGIHAPASENGFVGRAAKKPVNLGTLSPEKALALHKAAGHLTIPGLFVLCDDCLASKGGRQGHVAVRSQGHVAKQPLEQLNIDFYGKLTPSYNDNLFCLVVICDITSFVWIYPIRAKSQVTEIIRELIEKVRVSDGWDLQDKVIRVVRSDNEPVLRSADYKQMLKKLGVLDTHSVPYSPQMNGVVERFMRTMGENLRANMRGVDERLWEWAVKYIAWCWNRIPKQHYARAPQFNGLAPLDARNSRKQLPKADIHMNDEYIKSLSPNSDGAMLPQAADSKIEPRSRKEFLLWQEPRGKIVAKNNKNKVKTVFENFEDYCTTVMNPKNSRGQVISEKSLDQRLLSKGSQILEKELGQPDNFSGLLECDSIPSAFVGKTHDPLKDLSKPVPRDSSLEDSSKNQPKGAMLNKIDRSYRWAQYFKPFGTLAYVLREPRDKVGKIDEKFQKAIFLGYSEMNSAYLFGIWVQDGRKKTDDDLEFRVIESRNAKFTEHRVQSLDHLKDGVGFWLNTGLDLASRSMLPLGVSSTHLPGATLPPSRNCERENAGGKVSQYPDWEPSWAQRGTAGGSTAGTRSGQTSLNRDSSVVVTGAAEPATTEKPKSNYDVWDNEVDNRENSKRPIIPDYNLSRPNKKRKTKSGNKKKCLRAICECSVVCEESENDLERKFGETGHFSGSTVSRELEGELDGVNQPNEPWGKDSHGSTITHKVFLSIKKALAGAESAQWKEAIDAEYNKLVNAGTWRDPTPEERTSGIQCIPLGVILNKKRSGQYKCRAVALGNRLDKKGVDVFAPTLSMTAHRMMLVKMARSGDFIQCFDIDAAFLNAKIDANIMVSLPEEFVKPGESRVKILEKALYGLPQSPKAWFQHYAKGLKELGWIQCENEACLWRKPSVSKQGKFLKLSVYVDDNIMTGPCELELEEQMAKVLAQYPGRIIQPIINGSSQTWDVLGADLQYDRLRRSMSLTMGSYIEKMAEKFNVKTTAPNPNVLESPLLDEKGDLKFPFREIIGSLQWVSTIARPDVARNINLLSRYLGKATTIARWDAAKRIVKYLLGTKNEGIRYSPENEYKFRETYSLDGDGNPVRKTDHVLFNDASFASNVDCYYSSSGSVLFLHGTPIAWKSGRQKIRAHSTCEAEWIAASDGISWASQISFLEFFEGKTVNLDAKLPDDLIVMCDNKSAVVVAKTDEVKPKSRHYALRLFRVREESSRVVFCRTDLMCADALTKAVSGKQRALLLGYGAVLPQ